MGKFDEREKKRIQAEPDQGPKVTEKTKEKKLITLMVDVEMLSVAKVIAKRRGNTITSVLNDALRNYVKENSDLL